MAQTTTTKHDADLLAAAKLALVYFENHLKGNARNGQYDDIICGRTLRAAIDAAEAARAAAGGDAAQAAE